MKRASLIFIALVGLVSIVMPCSGQVSGGGPPSSPVGPAPAGWGTVSGKSPNSTGAANTNLFSYAGGPDSINLGNLNIHWDIPIRSKAGRGLNFSYDLTYDSSLWYPVTSGSTKTWQPVTGWGWNGLSLAGQTYLNYSMTITTGTCGEYGNGTYEIWTYGNVFYHDQYARVHQFNAASTYITTNGVSGCPTPGPHPPQEVTVSDGQGMLLTYEPTQGQITIYSLMTKDGTTISPPVYINSSPNGTLSYSEMDGNGNEITGSNGTFTDTLGTTALNIIGSAPSSTTISYANSSGTSTYTVNYEEVNIKTNFGCSGISEYSQSNVYLPQTIQLPDGRQYIFSYETTPGNTGYTTGRVASVQTPTGGTIYYNYTGGSNGIECTDGSTSGIHQTTPDTGSNYWNYARSNVVGNSSTTTITAPPANGSQDQTVINFLTDGASSYANFYEIYRATYSGSSTLLETVLTCYEPATNTSACSQTAGDTGSNVVEPITRVQKTFQWPGSTTLSSGYLDTYDTSTNQLTHAVYDYASGTSYGSLLQTTTATYTSINTVGTIEGPQEVKVTDGSGAEITDTKYTYTSTVTTTSGTPSHQSGGLFIQNLASVAQWVSGTSYLTSSYTYYDTGDVYQAMDVNSNTTTYTYGNCGNSFPTLVSTPTGSTTLSITAAWNCTGGVLSNSHDVNTNETTYGYGSDPYWRGTSVTNNATGAVATYAYPSSSSTSSASTMNFNSNSSTNTSVTTYDSLGRAVLQQTLQAPGSSNYDSVAVSYDTRGRLAYQSAPYTGTEGKITTTGPGVTTTYDALNRRITVTDGGSGTKQFGYDQNDVLVTLGPAPSGENSKKRNLQYNGAGWLTSVCEVVTSTLPAGGTCGQANPQTGYLTKYTYDGGGRLTLVQQNAQTSSIQTRQIWYDGLSRKTKESIPEWSAGTGSPGSATYSYDSATTACATGSTGDLVQSVDHIGNTTCYTYDKLHRPLSTVVVSGSYAPPVTPAAYYVYDAASYGSTAMQNAKGTLAEAYTCASTACSSKLTDIYVSTSAVTTGTMAGGAQVQMWESTPNSGGYFLTTDTYYPNGAVGAVSAVLGSSSIGIPNLTYGVDGEGRPYSASDGTHNLVTTTTYCPTQLQVTYGNASTGSANDVDTFGFDSATGRPTTMIFNINPSPSTSDYAITTSLTWNRNGSLAQMAYTDGNDST